AAPPHGHRRRAPVRLRGCPQESRGMVALPCPIRGAGMQGGVAMRLEVQELIGRLESPQERHNHDLVYELCIATRPGTFFELLEMLPRTPNKTIIEGWMEYQSRPAMATSQETDLYAAIADALGEY